MNSMRYTGTMRAGGTKYGFILPDGGGEDMFVIPPSCRAWGNELPPEGTRLSYKVVTDQKTGRPRADDVEPEGAWPAAPPAASSPRGWSPQWPSQHAGPQPTRPPHHPYEPAKGAKGGKGAAPQKGAWQTGTWQHGTMAKDSGKFGFITQDAGGPDMFVLPVHCRAFGGLPPRGTRVVYRVGTDPMKGEPCAEDVQPETPGASRPAPAQADWWPATQSPRERQWTPSKGPTPAPVEGPQRAGTMRRSGGKFGFIHQDDSEEDMFVLPAHCQAFGGVLPPEGTRVVYSVVTDQKTGRPRAENVLPEEGGEALAQEAPEAVEEEAPAEVEEEEVGGGVEEVEALLLEDGDPVPEEQEAQGEQADGMALEESLEDTELPGMASGIVAKQCGNFGFIKQDSGEPDIFVLPMHCRAFPSGIPPAGTRVIYRIGTDPQKGRPQAEDVQPEADIIQAVADMGAPEEHAAPMRDQPAVDERDRTGTMLRGSDRFGFIKQDTGEPDMFVMPVHCKAFGGYIPPPGTRVLYRIGVDPQKHEPCAVNVRPETVGASSWQAASAPPGWGCGAQNGWRPAPGGTGGLGGGERAGTMLKSGSKFGFLKQDSGEEDMFILPQHCQAFGGELPPEGTRVIYTVVPDAKTGRPRADNVVPESQYQSFRKGDKGKGKGLALAARPGPYSHGGYYR